MNKPYAELPEAFKAFIIGTFKSIDVDGMWPSRLKKATFGVKYYSNSKD